MARSILPGQQTVFHVDQRDLAAEAGERLGEFAANGAAAELYSVVSPQFSGTRAQV